MNIVFIQPRSFLRLSKRTNPYFDPIIGCVESWRLFLPKGEKSGYPAERVRYYGAVDFWATWFWRGMHILMPWLSAERVHWLFGKVARPFLGEWAKADLIITIAGVLADELAGAFPKKRIVDIQHGVIYSTHNGYFNKDGSVNAWQQRYQNRELWVYGKGYADYFFKNPENHKWMDGRVRVIGDVARAGNQVVDSSCSGRNSPTPVIAVSLQFTPDFSKEVLQSWADDLCRVFERIEAAGLQKKYPVVMRHHPRYGNSFDLGPMLKRFPWLTLTEEPTIALIRKSVYHITYMSTSAFEYAAEGVPTLFTASDKNRIAVDLMYGEYGYPIPLKFEEMAKALESGDELRRQGDLVKAWYRKFYEPFSAENCAKLLI